MTHVWHIQIRGVSVSDFLIKNIIFLVLLNASGCRAAIDTVASVDNCQDYVSFYLSFHRVMVNGEFSEKKSALLDSLHVHPEDRKNSNNLKKLVTSYEEHETEIKEISEVYASCKLEQKYASLWFKITDSDERFSRLYVVISEGKISTLSKELAVSTDDIDSGKVYVRIK